MQQDMENCMDSKAKTKENLSMDVVIFTASGEMAMLERRRTEMAREQKICAEGQGKIRKPWTSRGSRMRGGAT